MTARAGRRLRIAAAGLLLLALLLVLAAAGAVYAFVRASLPQLDGALNAPGLHAPVRISRDAYGVPTLRGTSRADVAYATGFVHAQDRFFQMDLLRRAGSGELAALLGPSLLNVDRERRIHRFGARATVAVAALPAGQRALLDAYTAGVNAGLDSLAARPFEYAVLRTAPRPWRAEDSLLVVWAMYFDLQEDQLHREFSRGWLRDHETTPEQLAFLLPTATAYDAPLDAPAIDEPEVPIPAAAPPWFGRPPKMQVAQADDLLPGIGDPSAAAVGSNNGAVAGSRSKTGAAIVSVDMHLGLRLPSLPYRAVLEIAPPGVGPMRLVGVMLAGAPLFVGGSNGRVAWGFTNSYGDYLDLVELERYAKDPSRYRSAAGWVPMRISDERIDVNGGPAELLQVHETGFGPVWERGGRGYALRWTAHDAGAADLAFAAVEGAANVAEALAAGQRAGLPAQNMVAGDSTGRIGWSIAGPLPDRQASWATSFPRPATAPGALGWTARTPPAAYPVIVDPPAAQLSTANARQLAGPSYARIGDGGADLGARARQIRDSLAALGTPTDEAGLYGVALDDRALYLAPWRERALRALDERATDPATQAKRVGFKRLLQTTWTGRASVDSVAYALSRAFVSALYRRLFGGIDDTLRAADRSASFARASARWPAVLARLLDAEPPGWLPPGQASWRGVQLAAIDDVIAEATRSGLPLAEARWGRRNAAHIVHPLAAALPFGSAWLAAPADELPGDNHMPRVSAPDFGQSERLVVSPGHEAEGLFNLPGGQSGHPLSPYFLAGHAEWVAGRPQPLLPGPAVHELMLLPAAAVR